MRPRGGQFGQRHLARAIRLNDPNILDIVRCVQSIRSVQGPPRLENNPGSVRRPEGKVITGIFQFGQRSQSRTVRMDSPNIGGPIGDGRWISRIIKVQLGFKDDL